MKAVRQISALVFYEAEYRRPDGSITIGPAEGIIPYSAPNILVSLPTLALAIFLFRFRPKAANRLDGERRRREQVLSS